MTIDGESTNIELNPTEHVHQPLIQLITDSLRIRRALTTLRSRDFGQCPRNMFLIFFLLFIYYCNLIHVYYNNKLMVPITHCYRDHLVITTNIMPVLVHNNP